VALDASPRRPSCALKHVCIQMDPLSGNSFNFFRWIWWFYCSSTTLMYWITLTVLLKHIVPDPQVRDGNPTVPCSKSTHESGPAFHSAKQARFVKGSNPGWYYTSMVKWRWRLRWTPIPSHRTLISVGVAAELFFGHHRCTTAATSVGTNPGKSRCWFDPSESTLLRWFHYQNGAFSACLGSVTDRVKWPSIRKAFIGIDLNKTAL
jgi:hypothetical protein